MLYLSTLLIEHHELQDFEALIALIKQVKTENNERFFRIDVSPTNLHGAVIAGRTDCFQRRGKTRCGVEGIPKEWPRTYSSQPAAFEVRDMPTIKPTAMRLTNKLVPP